MDRVHQNGNGSSPPWFRAVTRRLTVSLHKRNIHLPLWPKVISAAYEMTHDEAECELLRRTRLLDIDGSRFVVAFAGDPLEPDERHRLRRLLDHALTRVGLNCHRVHLVSNPRA